MKGFNQVILLGRLGADPEVKTLNGDKTVARFSLATGKVWTTSEGEKREKTEWHRIVVWGKLAEVCGKYLSKGSVVLIEGELNHRSWENDQGEKKYSTEINAKSIQFVDTKRKDSSQSDSDEGSYDDDGGSNFNPDDEIPF